MYHAISAELKTSDKVVLIGSDCLEMDSAYIESAFAKLQTERDVVFGPANDGGYVLVGMSASNSGLFNNVRWGFSNVLASTLKNARSLGVTTHLLDTLVDVDHVRDLQVIASRNRLPEWALSLLPKY